MPASYNCFISNNVKNNSKTATQVKYTHIASSTKQLNSDIMTEKLLVITVKVKLFKDQKLCQTDIETLKIQMC